MGDNNLKKIILLTFPPLKDALIGQCVAMFSIELGFSSSAHPHQIKNNPNKINNSVFIILPKTT